MSYGASRKHRALSHAGIASIHPDPLAPGQGAVGAAGAQQRAYQGVSTFSLTRPDGPDSPPPSYQSRHGPIARRKDEDAGIVGLLACPGNNGVCRVGAAREPYLQRLAAADTSLYRSAASGYVFVARWPRGPCSPSA